MCKVAICYWGLTRSLKKVYQSHIDKLYNILKQNGIEYNIFMHTWYTDNPTIWLTKQTTPPDYSEHLLINPDYYNIDNEQEFLNNITFSDYCNQELFDKYGDSQYEWIPGMIQNHICGIESQKRVTDMVLNSGVIYDYVIYVRPDVEIVTTFSLNFLNFNNNEICIPMYDNFEGYNDRFAIVRYANMAHYGKRIDEIIEFKKRDSRVVPEKYVKHIIQKYFTRVHFIDFVFTIVRP